MIVIVGISITIQLIAVLWSLALLRRLRDWRIGFLTVMFTLMAIRQLLTLWKTPTAELTVFASASSELPGLLVSIMALLSILSIEKILIAPKVARENLKEVEQRFQQLTDHLEEIFWITSIDGEKVIYVSPAYERIFERKLEDLYRNPKSWLNFILPEDQPAVVRAFTRENLVRGLFNIEYRIKRSNGTIRWIKARGFPVKNELGETHRIVGVAADVTQQKLIELALKNSQAELERRVQERTQDLQLANDSLKKEMTERQRFVHALEESEERFRKVFEEGKIGMVFAGPDFNFTRANSAFCEMFGYTEEEIKTMTFMDFTHPEDIEKNEVLMKQLIEGDIPSIKMEKRCLRKDGETIWVNTNVFLIRVQREAPSYNFIGLVENISPRKAMEAKLVESEENFRQIAENVEEVLWMKEIEEEKIIYVSPAFEKIWGHTLTNLFKNPNLWAESIHPEDRSKIEHLNSFHSKKIILSGICKAEFRIIRPDGSLRWIQDRAFPVCDSQGRPFRIVGISQDITDLKSAQEEAETASRAKSEFLSHMSHELRTPLNAILGYAQLLSLDKNNVLPSQQRGQVQQILSAGNHLLDLINEVLDLTRIETGSLKILKENTDVTLILKRLFPVIQPLAEEKHICLEDRISSRKDFKVYADPVRLKQALLNLVSNAIKYNHEGGKVSIEGEITSQNTAKIHVVDDGPGLSETKIKSIFEPFERLGAEFSGVEGTGIGLTIAQRLISLMDGTLSVQSALGEGSCFTIELPASLSHDEIPQKNISTPIDIPEAVSTASNSHTILY
nr:PAS domain-containing protein [Nitrospinaceae bacterium]NIR56950.1 PAS domain-containing protein [Nitrospinaceae bacterium]NIS87406.1 PAS domain-containing protein [Nitrospinaceae bacterium]NIT84258.1 PAS domain-containing protein [Nitrospinaceae bacterium]NIU46446.1 PAS domain-containing protein [Nitrospinaceae bacterium]